MRKVNGGDSVVVRRIKVQVEVDVSVLYAVPATGDPILKGIGASISQGELQKIGLLEADTSDTRMLKGGTLICTTEDLNLGAMPLSTDGCVLYCGVEYPANVNTKARSSDDRVHYKMYSSTTLLPTRLHAVMCEAGSAEVEQTSSTDITVGSRRAHQIHAIHGREIRGVSILDHLVEFSSAAEDHLKVRHCRKRTAVDASAQLSGTKSVMSHSLEYTPGGGMSGTPKECIDFILDASQEHDDVDIFKNTLRAKEVDDRCAERLCAATAAHSQTSGARAFTRFELKECDEP